MRRLLIPTVFAAALAVPGVAAADHLRPTRDAPIVVADTVISRSAIERWAEVARKASIDGLRPRQARAQAVSLLVSIRWTRRETWLRGIEVPRREVRRALRRQSADAFGTRAEFRAWRREHGQTRAMLRFRIRFDLLSWRLRRVATEGAASA